MAEAEFGSRDDRGHWRPFKNLAPPPLFVWPPKPVGFVKWLFGYPGYLFPWTLIYLAISLLTWRYLTPDLADMQTLRPGWIGFILARNFVLVVLVYSAWHVSLYFFRSQGTQFKYNARWPMQGNKTFLFSDQTKDNIAWTLGSAVPIWTGYEVVSLWMMANGFIPYLDIEQHPIYAAFMILVILLFRELHFYLTHRAIHWPPLYKRIHYLHHKNANPGPWSGLSMHPLEHLIYFSAALLHWVIPSHPIHVIFHLQHLAFAPAQGHSGFERIIVNGKAVLQPGDYFHNLHHRFFECNYGGDGTIPFDKWFGTFHDGTPEATERMKARRKARIGH